MSDSELFKECVVCGFISHRDDFIRISKDVWVCFECWQDAEIQKKLTREYPSAEEEKIRETLSYQCGGVGQY